jgi:putative transposase
MDQTSISELEQLNVDYVSVTGELLSHFFCPILFKVEETELRRTDPLLPAQIFRLPPRFRLLQDPQDLLFTKPTLLHLPSLSGSFASWEYGGLELSEAKRLKLLEEENGKLKVLVAELSLDNKILKDLATKKW